MADKKVFTLVIDGVKQSTTDVISLVDALNKIENINKKVTIETDRVSKSTSESTKVSKEKTKVLTDEEKVQKRLDDLQIKINHSKTESAKREVQLREELRQNNLTLRQTVRTNESAEGSIEKHRSELARLRNEYVKLSREVRESDIGKNMLGDIQKLTKDTQDLNKSIGVTSDRVGSYEDAITSALGINGDFAKSIVGLSKSNTGSNGLSAFFTNIGASAQAFGKTLLGLLSNPVFLAIAGIAGAGLVFKFWFDYNKGLVEATRLTKQFTDLSGNDLKAFRNEIQGIADTFGKDYKETLEGTNAVAKQFGISQQEALKLVKDGFIAGADANGEYLQTLKEYPAYFKEAGISASEFIAITAETANQGIFSDKGIDAIKEANIRLREMTKSTADALDGIGISSKQVQKDLQNGTTTTFEVMQKVSEKLNEYPEQSKQVGTAIADIFGGAGEDAGLQYLKTLKDIDTNLDNVKDKAGELGQIQERQMNANIELQNAVSALFDQTGGTFETMIGNAKVFATESLTSVIKGLISVANWFIYLYNNVERVRFFVNASIATFKTFFEIISIGLKSAIDGFKSLGNIITALATGDAKLLAKTLTDIPKTITDNISDSIAKISSIASDAIDEINNGKIDPIEIPVNVITDSEETNKNSGKGGKTALTDAQKKAIEAEKKALIELTKFRLETEINNQKEIYSNTNKAYDERLIALNKYQNLQRAYIEKDQELQILALRKQYSTEEEFQKNASNQIALIKEKANQKIIDLDKELADSSLQIMRDYESKELEILNINIQNRLAIVKQGSEEELTLILQQLELQRQAEIDEAEKTGADKKAINDKYFELEKRERQYQADYLNKQTQTEYQNQILQAQLINKNTLSLQIKAKQYEISTLARLDSESDTDYLNRKLTLQNQLKQLEDDLLKYQMNKISEYVQNISNALSSVFDAIGSVMQMELDDANEKLDAISEKYDEVVEKREESDNRLQELEEKAKDARGGRSLILQEQINAEMAANQQLASQEKQLAKDKEKQEKEIAKKEKQQKRVQLLQNMAQVIASTSEGIMKAYAASPLTFGLPWSAVIGAAGVLQAGVITSQLSKLEDGGLLKGKRHSQGGMRVEGTNIEVEGGEYVINRESTDKNIGLIKYINSQRRSLGPNDLNSFFSKNSQGFEPPFKRIFEAGGQLPSIENTISIDNDSLVDAIHSIKIEPKVAVTDINNAQDESVKVDSWSGM